MSEEIRLMFGRIAKSYDLANDLLSFGIHRYWRKSLVSFGGVGAGHRVLDLCAGTGDLSLQLASRVGNGGHVLGMDFSPEMIALANAKLGDPRSLTIKDQLIFKIGDALATGEPSGSYDFVTVAFGIRNVDGLDLFFKEAHRVLKPSGKLLVIEFGQPKIPIFNTIFAFYSRHILPLIGGLVTGDRRAYKYLHQTSAVFPCAERFTEKMSVYFKSVEYQALLGGIAYLYKGNAH